jgi:hypothetical protein
MQLKLPLSLVSSIIEETKDAHLIHARDTSPLKRFVLVDGLKLEKKTLKALYKATSELSTGYSDNLRFLYSALKNKDDLRVRSMRELKTALVSYLKKNAQKYFLFAQGDYNSVLPYLVKNVYEDVPNSYRRSGQPEVYHTYLQLAWSTVSNSQPTRSIVFTPSFIEGVCKDQDIDFTPVMSKRTKDYEPYMYDFMSEKGVLVEDLLQAYGLFKENEDLHELYSSQIERFMKFLPMYGQQFRVRGTASSSSAWSSYGASMLYEGRPGRAIMDTIPALCLEDEKKGKTSRRDSYDDDDDDSYYSRRRSGRSSEDDKFRNLADLTVPLKEVSISDLQYRVQLEFLENTFFDAPLHPSLRIYHLDKHTNFTVHVNNLAPYKYKDDISRHLVLEPEVKKLAGMLVSVAKDADEVEDVIEGKSQNVMITCIGDPGVGKTLMAEVLSEACHKPLYKVPADQLGSDAESLESSLRHVLRKAERWDCVLMIDEANAYVHSRGSDIRQNAIVGVFLRLVEYFKGTLILTTNQTNADGTSFDIDDAILSRSTAVFNIGLPSAELARQIYKSQAELQKIEGLTDKMIDKLLERYTLSGRSIRQLLRLSSRWAKHLEEPLSLKHFDFCAKHIPFARNEAVKINKD